jgi:hypothetical protein
MTFLMICAMLRTALLLGGLSVWFDMKNWPPASSPARGFGFCQVRSVAVHC